MFSFQNLNMWNLSRVDVKQSTYLVVLKAPKSSHHIIFKEIWDIHMNASPNYISIMESWLFATLCYLPHCKTIFSCFIYISFLVPKTKLKQKLKKDKHNEVKKKNSKKNFKSKSWQLHYRLKLKFKIRFKSSTLSIPKLVGFYEWPHISFLSLESCWKLSKDFLQIRIYRKLQFICFFKY